MRTLPETCFQTARRLVEEKEQTARKLTTYKWKSQIVKISGNWRRHRSELGDKSGDGPLDVVVGSEAQVQERRSDAQVRICFSDLFQKRQLYLQMLVFALCTFMSYGAPM